MASHGPETQPETQHLPAASIRPYAITIKYHPNKGNYRHRFYNLSTIKRWAFHSSFIWQDLETMCIPLPTYTLARSDRYDGFVTCYWDASLGEAVLSDVRARVRMVIESLDNYEKFDIVDIADLTIRDCQLDLKNSAPRSESEPQRKRKLSESSGDAPEVPKRRRISDADGSNEVDDDSGASAVNGTSDLGPNPLAMDGSEDQSWSEEGGSWSLSPDNHIQLPIASSAIDNRGFLGALSHYASSNSITFVSGEDNNATSAGGNLASQASSSSISTAVAPPSLFTVFGGTSSGSGGANPSLAAFDAQSIDSSGSLTRSGSLFYGDTNSMKAPSDNCLVDTVIDGLRLAGRATQSDSDFVYRTDELSTQIAVLLKSLEQSNSERARLENKVTELEMQSMFMKGKYERKCAEVELHKEIKEKLCRAVKGVRTAYANLERRHIRFVAGLDQQSPEAHNA